MIAITVNDKDVIQRLTALGKELGKPQALARVVGQEGVRLLKAHFRQKDKTPNKLGGKRVNYWRQVADSVNNQAVVSPGGSQVTIGISSPTFAQKLYGGTITAKRGKALTIPVRPEAYGRAAKQLEDAEGVKLFVLSLSGQGPGTGYLAAKAEDGAVKIYYVLRASVEQAPDPTALPDMAGFKAALVDNAERYVADKIAKRTPNPPSAGAAP